MVLLAWTAAALAQTAPQGGAAPNKCEGSELAGAHAATPVDPYPLNAAGWGPEIGQGLMASRWAEDWSGMRAAGLAPWWKALPLAGAASLTLSAEARLRYDNYGNGQLTPGNDYRQGLLRAVLGADLRLHPQLRVYAELGSGQVAGRRASASANFQNDASLQQLFVDVRRSAGGTLVGAMLGRQEFADGPRQLLSLSDGPNMHRSWNGVRLYAHGEGMRVGAFELRATRLAAGFFDEEINHAERLRGLNASLIVDSGNGPNTYLDPFWIHSDNPAYRAAGKLGRDARDTVGARLWGRRGDLRFDWTLAHQSGRSVERDVDAWGLFAVHSLALSGGAWKPSLTAHVDIASGGASAGGGSRGFNQLYASSNYLGEGQFLSLANLLMIAPGISFTPTPASKLAVEYGFARRLSESDAAYAGGMRAYAGTQKVSGRRIGGLLRIVGNWSVSERLSLVVNYERLVAGDVLTRAGLPSGRYAYIGATFRY
ncbi:alginate export family protein [Rugamonas sp. CCM 8940]|uniref:alginate export family protein n=1 Tax=Rugamonas sp. CCM 8940 TaxID=2765359 RepID=UPI0018F5225D|nr:alginate export family protein [Rugamonas sp. CCM 8940]MBJ7310917.1 alginate export family protein [Rugamonas sp. CCM 8940]